MKDYKREEEMKLREIWIEIYLGERAQGSSRLSSIAEADAFLRDYKETFEPMENLK